MKNVGGVITGCKMVCAIMIFLTYLEGYFFYVTTWELWKDVKFINYVVTKQLLLFLKNVWFEISVCTKEMPKL